MSSCFTEDPAEPWWETQGPVEAPLPSGWRRYLDELTGQWCDMCLANSLFNN